MHLEIFKNLHATQEVLHFAATCKQFRNIWLAHPKIISNAVLSRSSCYTDAEALVSAQLEMGRSQPWILEYAAPSFELHLDAIGKSTQRFIPYPAFKSANIDPRLLNSCLQFTLHKRSLPEIVKFLQAIQNRHKPPTHECSLKACRLILKPHQILRVVHAQYVTRLWLLQLYPIVPEGWWCLTRQEMTSFMGQATPKEHQLNKISVEEAALMLDALKCVTFPVPLRLKTTLRPNFKVPGPITMSERFDIACLTLVSMISRKISGMRLQPNVRPELVESQCHLLSWRSKTPGMACTFWLEGVIPGEQNWA